MVSSFVARRLPSRTALSTCMGFGGGAVVVKEMYSPIAM